MEAPAPRRRLGAALLVPLALFTLLWFETMQRWRDSTRFEPVERG